MPPSKYEYKWNSTKKDLILLNAEDNDIVRLKRIEDFFNKLRCCWIR